MKYTTSKLILTIRDRWHIHERTIREAGWLGIFVTTLALISTLLRPPAAPPRVTVIREPAAIVIMKETALPLPTAAPLPTPEPVVQYITLPTPEPQVIYVESPPVTLQEAPQQAEGQAQVVDDVAPTPEVLCDARCLNIQGHYVEPPHLQTFAVLPGDDISPAQLREAQDK